MEGCGFHVAFRGDVHWDIMGYRGFLYWGLPKNGWFVMQHPIFLIDDLWGTLIFRNRHVVGFNGYFMKVYRDAVERKYQT